MLWMERDHVGAGFKPALAQPTRTIWLSAFMHMLRIILRLTDAPENTSRAVSAEAGRV